jgi:hypothetical protein
VQVNKKLEVCKFYLNGYCAKNTNCTYMHAEFPCKFYHTNKECLNGINCRFSHAPLTPEMRDLFEKYLKECDETPVTKKPSLLGSPPRHLKDQQDKLAEHGKKQTLSVSTQRAGLLPLPIPSLLSKQITTPSNIPSLMDIPIAVQIKPVQQIKSLPYFCQDIDERSAPAPISTDIDERAQPQLHADSNSIFAKLLQQQQQQQQIQIPSLVSDIFTNYTNTPTTTTTIPIVTSESLLSNLFNHNNNYMKEEKLTIDDSDASIEIDARTDGTLPYIIYPIDVEPSSLWTHPPVTNTTTSNSNDSECIDPRIEFYSNKANNKYLNDKTNLQMLENNQLLASSLMSSSSSSALSPPPPQQQSVLSLDDLKAKCKDYRDPRLLRNESMVNDLINIQMSKATTSLLSSLPDLKLPTSKPLMEQFTGVSQFKGNTNYVDANNVVKLSIEDYKRKLNKPDDYSQKTFSYSPQQQHQQIPSYSVTNLTNSMNDIKPPQSLHELLKNFPS